MSADAEESCCGSALSFPWPDTLSVTTRGATLSPSLLNLRPTHLSSPARRHFTIDRASHGPTRVEFWVQDTGRAIAALLAGEPMPVRRTASARAPPPLLLAPTGPRDHSNNSSWPMARSLHVDTTPIRRHALPRREADLPPATIRPREPPSDSPPRPPSATHACVLTSRLCTGHSVRVPRSALPAHASRGRLARPRVVRPAFLPLCRSEGRAAGSTCGLGLSGCGDVYP